MTRDKKIRVLFVCLGNICRSPMAESIFRHKVEAAGLSDAIEIDSAGTGSWHIGERPHRGTVRELQRRGIAVGDQRARQVTSEELEGYDYVLAMDLSNLNEVRGMMRRSGVSIEPRLMLEYIDDPNAPTEVPDPYYERNFDRVFDLLDEATDGLLADIVERHNLKRT